MDRSLDEVIQDRQQRREPRGGRAGRRNNDDYPRDGIRKSTYQRNDPTSMDKAWTHDRYEGDSNSRRPQTRDRIIDRYDPKDNRAAEGSAKLRITNLHYDLTETDLRELFSRIGPLSSLSIQYDRSDRSRGIALVTYTSARDADLAIREFDGANAYGQPITVTAVAQGPAPGRRNPFDAVMPREGRSLFDRVEAGGDRAPARRSRRSESPVSLPRRSDVTKPAPEGIDRYVPGAGSRRRSPAPGGRRGDRGSGGRRPGARREESGRGNRGEGRAGGGGRSRKTAEQLDAEMEDYWGGNGTAAKDPVGVAQTGEINAVETAGFSAPAASTLDDDIDMIE